MYQLHAIKYAELNARKRSDLFVGGDPHDGRIDMDYFIWVALGADRVCVVDTGFSAEVAARRGRRFLRSPVETLADLGIDAASVRDVIITHLHYDHVGNFGLFPNARFHLQDREMAFATGRQMGHAFMRAAYEVEDIVGMVRAVYAERVVFHDGDAAIAPGIEVHPTRAGSRRSVSRPGGGGSCSPQMRATTMRTSSSGVSSRSSTARPTCSRAIGGSGSSRRGPS